MKVLLSSDIVTLPKRVSAKIHGRKIEIKGPRGVVKQDFSHMNISIQKMDRKHIKVAVWFGRRRETECLNTACSLIKNMITGVTEGYRMKMRLVYAHYPIQFDIDENKREFEVRNYFGQKLIRKGTYPEGVKVYSSKVKDEVVVDGIDLPNVSLAAARIHKAARCKDLDIRIFLDGIYITDRTNMESAV